MLSKKHIILVGDSHTLDQFVGPLAHAGISTMHVERVDHVIDAARKEKPNAIVFVLPRYWDDITVFVDEI
ncbi:MAG: hypothetical protein G01um101470_529, partial [Parcubacteria group bacterium Gr01-1014_70]